VAWNERNRALAAQRMALGRMGERLAEQLLLDKGARILARNQRFRFGEIDLVVEHEGDLVAVEVKTRHLGQPALPEEAVGPAKLARLERLLAEVARLQRMEECGCRIDVVAVEVDPLGDVHRVEHIRDAYDGA
jgi:putative endonuclease